VSFTAAEPPLLPTTSVAAVSCTSSPTSSTSESATLVSASSASPCVHKLYTTSQSVTSSDKYFKQCISSNLSDVSSSSSAKQDESCEQSANSASFDVSGHWEPPRVVSFVREPDQGLGFSIVGGKVDMFSTHYRGIFIKNVMPESPAGRTEQFKRGDRILEVCGVDLRDASHDQAVEAIKNAPTTIEFLVQSLSMPIGGEQFDAPSSPNKHINLDVVKNVPLFESHETFTLTSASATLAAITSVVTDEDTAHDVDNTTRSESSSPSLTATDEDNIFIRIPVLDKWTPCVTPTPEVIQEGLDDEEKIIMQTHIDAFKSQQQQESDTVDAARKPLTSKLSSTFDSEDDDYGIDDREMQGNVTNKHGIEVRCG